MGSVVVVVLITLVVVLCCVILNCSCVAQNTYASMKTRTRQAGRRNRDWKLYGHEEKWRKNGYEPQVKVNKNISRNPRRSSGPGPEADRGLQGEKFSVMKKIPCSEDARQMLERAFQMDPKKMRTRYIMALVALNIVCENVKERSACSILFVQETDDMPATPCVSYNGVVLEDAEFFWLMVDQTKCFQVINAEEALVAIMCANWLFNVQYACKAFNTLVILKRFFLEL